MISGVSSTFSSKSETVMMESRASQQREGKTQGSHPGYSQSSSEDPDTGSFQGLGEAQMIVPLELSYSRKAKVGE